MMNNFRKIISVFLSVLLLMTVVPVTVGAVSQTSGQCGDNVFWSYDETTKTFTVSGSGATYNYSQNDREWVSSSIDTSSVDYCTLFVVIENGVTAIGDCMFMGFDNLLRVDMADTVTSIGEDVFEFCYDLKFVKPAPVEWHIIKL